MSWYDDSQWREFLEGHWIEANDGKCPKCGCNTFTVISLDETVGTLATYHDDLEPELLLCVMAQDESNPTDDYDYICVNCGYDGNIDYKKAYDETIKSLAMLLEDWKKETDFRLSEQFLNELIEVYSEAIDRGTRKSGIKPYEMNKK